MFGLAELTVGVPTTVKRPVPVPRPASVLVTMTSRPPTVAPAAIVMFAVICVALLRVVELTVMPLPENDATTPVAKPVPRITMFWLVAP